MRDQAETLTPVSDPWLHGYAIFLACATFLLVIAGALVTSNDAGLSVPDWPTSFGSFRMPRMVGGVLYEHGHRMIAGTVGLLTMIFAVWLWVKEPRRWLRRLGGAAVMLIVAQAILGGMTVLFYLPVPISVAHAALGQLFFCITTSLAVFTRPGWRWDEVKVEDSSTPALRHLALATTGAVLLQLVLGAGFRHAGFGIAPHLIGAVFVTVLVFWTVTRVLTGQPNKPGFRRQALLVLGLFVLQLFLGLASYTAREAAKGAPQPLPQVVAITTAHVAVGALVLAACLVLTLKAYRRLQAPRGSYGVTTFETAGS